jgi:hypothetical protein
MFRLLIAIIKKKKKVESCLIFIVKSLERREVVLIMELTLALRETSPTLLTDSGLRRLGLAEILRECSRTTSPE